MSKAKKKKKKKKRKKSVAPPSADYRVVYCPLVVAPVL